MAAPVTLPALPSFASARDLNDFLVKITAGGVLVRNFVGVLLDTSEASLVVESPLFPKDALEFYTKYNLNLLDVEHSPEDAELYRRFYNAARGGGQGDYRDGIQGKIANVVDCLTKFPKSKRAVITIPGRSIDHAVDEDAKCLRELHFYLEPSAGASAAAGAPASLQLSCTGLMRAQAATIFPKNIHYIGRLVNLIAGRLGVRPGAYTHIVTTLIDGRES